MRLLIGVAGVAALATGIYFSSTTGILGFGVSAQPGPPPDYYTVHALPITTKDLSGVLGKFQMLKVSAANGIPSDRLGGACIIFDPSDLGLSKMAGISCTSNTDCQDSAASAGYCDGKTHSCWARPLKDTNGDILCNKGKVFPANALNPVPKTPAELTQFGIKSGAKMRVVACINKPWKGPPPPPPPCGMIESADRIEVMGPVATVK